MVRTIEDERFHYIGFEKNVRCPRAMHVGPRFVTVYRMRAYNGQLDYRACLQCLRIGFVDLPPRGNGWPLYETRAHDAFA